MDCSDRLRPVYTPGPGGPPPPPRERYEIKGEARGRCTGRFRLRVGWFGRAILEQQEELGDGTHRPVLSWRRAPRGMLVMLPFFGVDLGSGDFAGYWSPAGKDPTDG